MEDILNINNKNKTTKNKNFNVFLLNKKMHLNKNQKQ